MTRRDLYRYGCILLQSLTTLVCAVPAVAFLASPLLKRSQGRRQEADEFTTVSSLSHLKVGEPRSFAIIQDRSDAWVKYPSEPVGSVWLVREPEGAGSPVIAYTAECPHLGCAINLAADGRSFLCPCHTSAFDLEGKPENQVPPRPMDRLEVRMTTDADPAVRVRFQRFRPLAEEQIPLA